VRTRRSGRDKSGFHPVAPVHLSDVTTACLAEFGAGEEHQVPMRHGGGQLRHSGRMGGPDTGEQRAAFELGHERRQAHAPLPIRDADPPGIESIVFPEVEHGVSPRP
jgi:hypothetical protein